MSRHLAALLLALACATRAEAVDFERFLARHDLVWERTPTNWFAAPFLGNGTMGAMLYRTGTNTVRIDIGRGDAYDHRKGGGAWHQRCRLPIGHFTLDTVGAIQLFNGRLDLWNAEFNGQVATDRGALRLRAFVHATRMVMVCEVEASGGESGARLDLASRGGRRARPLLGHRGAEEGSQAHAGQAVGGDAVYAEPTLPTQPRRR
jgi:hypothetical protein